MALKEKIDVLKMDPAGKSYAEVLQRILAKTWWSIDDVAIYLRKTRGGAKVWAARNGLRRSKTNNRITCKEWVDAALNRKS